QDLRRLEGQLHVGQQRLRVRVDFELDEVRIPELPRQPRGADRVLHVEAARRIGEQLHVFRDPVEQALLALGIQIQAAHRHGDQLAARGLQGRLHGGEVAEPPRAGKEARAEAVTADAKEIVAHVRSFPGPGAGAPPPTKWTTSTWSPSCRRCVSWSARRTTRRLTSTATRARTTFRLSRSSPTVIPSGISRSSPLSQIFTFDSPSLPVAAAPRPRPRLATFAASRNARLVAWPVRHRDTVGGGDGS